MIENGTWDDEARRLLTNHNLVIADNPKSFFSDDISKDDWFKEEYNEPLEGKGVLDYLCSKYYVSPTAPRQVYSE